MGDAVIATDGEGRVSFLNPVAETLTGWAREAASGKPLEHIFRITNQITGEPAESPVARVLREGVVVGLANHTDPHGQGRDEPPDRRHGGTHHG